MTAPTLKAIPTAPAAYISRCGSAVFALCDGNLIRLPIRAGAVHLSGGPHGWQWVPVTQALEAAWGRDRRPDRPARTLPRKLRPVPGLALWADDAGHLWSGRTPGRLRRLKGTTNPNGYKQVSVTGADGRQVTCASHRLVYRAWHGPIPEAHHVHHRNHRRDSNGPGNLAALTPAANSRAASAAGRLGKRLTPAKARRIVLELSRGVPVKRLAARFRVHPSTIYSVRAGNSWSAVSGVTRRRAA